MIQPADKSRLTRAKNALEKANAAYLKYASPYITNKYRKASTTYREIVNELKRKYKGVQLDFEL